MSNRKALLEQLGYRDLQAIAKECGLKASGKSDELIERILEFEAGGGTVPPTTVKRGSGASAKTPRTSRKAAPAQDKAALLKAAASTPLPTGAKQAAEVDGEEEERPRVGRSTVRRRLSAQKSPAAGKSPAARSRSASAAPRAGPTVSGLGTPVFWLVLLTAAVAGLAALAVPYCQQTDCAALARSLPGRAAEEAGRLAAQARELAPTEAAAELYVAARARALDAVDAMQAQWRTLVALVLGDGGHASACYFDAAAALHAIMPVGDEFEGLRAAAASALGSQHSDKAAVALFVCEAADDCHSALRLLDEAVGPHESGAHCVLHLDGRHLGTDRGALQAQIASFLLAAPAGVVLLRRIDQMSPELLPVLINALSEDGSFQQGGMAVSTTRATFLLTSLMPLDIFHHLKDEMRFRQEAKTRLVVDLALRAVDKDAAKSQANALRRRVDLVIPIGSDPFPEDEQPADGEAMLEAGHASAGAEEAAPPACSLALESLLEHVIPDGQDVGALHEAAHSALTDHAGVKPPVALFACHSDASCAAVEAEVRRASADPLSCLLVLDAGRVTSEEALVNDLATFIRRTPRGTVLLSRLDQMTPDLLSPLVYALGFSGVLEPEDHGGAVDTVGTTFLLTSKVPAEAFEDLPDEPRFKAGMHSILTQDFKTRAKGNPDAAAILAEALQQRIDIVLPVGSEPAEWAAWQAQQAQRGNVQVEVEG